MNETEYSTDVPSTEEYLSEYQTEGCSESDNEVITESVTEVSAEAVTEVTAETTITTSESLEYDMLHIQHNTDGILLFTGGIFFLLVIWLVGRFIGGLFSM